MKRRRISRVLLVFVVAVLASAARAEIAKPKLFNVKSYGAVGDGVAMETEAIQKTIEPVTRRGAVSFGYFYDSPMGAMKLALVDGGRLEDIEISRVVMENVGCPIFIRLGNRGSTFGKGGKAPVGT